jgi:hypothetical protein
MDPKIAEEKAKAEDYLDFLITLIDNGDDKVCLTGKQVHSNSYSSLYKHTIGV